MAFNASVRSIYPGDIRQNPGAYGERFVAWVGIISRSSVSRQESDIEVDILVRHHYFDWIEDFRIGENTFTLSPSGEGCFRTGWYYPKDADMEYCRRISAAGNMVVVYGRPHGVLDEVVELEAAWVRFIPGRRVRFSDFPYARDAGSRY